MGQGLNAAILSQLQCVKAAICQLTAATSAPGSATEATLTALLAAVQQHQDYEFLLVRDPGAADLIVRQVIEYDETTDTFTYSYQTIAGAPYVPVGVPVYVDDTAMLDLMLTQLTAINADLDVALSTRASEGTAAAILAEVVGVAVAYNTSIESGIGSVPIGARGGSMFNIGPGTVVWNGATIPAGVGVPFDAYGKNNTLPAIAFDATGSSMVLEYTA